MPMVNSCCCDCSLKTGTIIIVIFNLILAYDLVITYYQESAFNLRVIGLIFSMFWICAQVIGLYGILISDNKNLLSPLITLMAIFIIMIGVDIVWILFISEHPILTPHLLKNDRLIDILDPVWKIICCVCYILLFSCSIYFLVVVYSFTQDVYTSPITPTQ